MFLENIRIREDFRNLVGGTEIELRPLTLFVGEQGCGKSTLLNLLHDNDVDIKMSKGVGSKSIESFFFDSELMNPRVKDPELFTNIDGSNNGIGYGAAISTRFKSHGEILREYTVERIKDVSDCVLILDEPESALSLRNQYKLAKEIKSALERNVQIVIATHCLPLIESVVQVYDMVNMKWVASSEFINKSKENV